MTRVIIEGLRDRASLINAISVVLDTLNSDDAYRHAEHVFMPHAHDGAEVLESTDDADVPEANTALEPDPAVAMKRGSGPTPFIPCPRRGAHELLTDCWMCWSDVMRGAALEPEVLTPAAWLRTGEPWTSA